jgi:hypothetical protein
VKSTSAQRTADPAIGPLTILAWTLWLGLLSGTLELAVFLLKCHYLDPRNYNVSRHFPCMYPVAGVLVLGGPGVVLALANALWPRGLSKRLFLFVLCFPVYLGLLFRCPIYTFACLVLAAALAYQTARLVAKRFAWCDQQVRRILPGLVGLLGLTVAVSYGREAWIGRRAAGVAAVEPRSARNVILIVLDTVRAGSLGLYGHDRETTPNLTRLAPRAIRFGRAYATAPWTAPSHASIFTGCWPHELEVGWSRPLRSRGPTLAEYLAARGYATAGFVANSTYCSYETGLARGFAHYEDYDVTLPEIMLCSALVQRSLNFLHTNPKLTLLLGATAPSSVSRKSAARINRDFLSWLSRTMRDDPERPFFAFLNYYDAHHPYFPPEPVSAPVAALGRSPETAAELRMIKTWWDLDKRGISAHDVALARDAYDRCIAYLDGQLGRLFQELAERGILEDTLVIVTADHGEHFGERQIFGHGCSLYRARASRALAGLRTRGIGRGPRDSPAGQPS